MVYRIQAFVIAAAAIVLLLGNTPAVKAECCDQVIIDNLSSCTFQVCLYVGGVQVECRTLTPGSNIFTLTSCLPETQIGVEVINRCGTAVHFPAPNSCDDIPITATCCIHVCTGSTTCFYEITDGICAAGC
jgi:hypothetical protein